MTSNIAIAKGALGNIPPVSLSFWRWFFVFLIIVPFVFKEINKNKQYLLQELPRLLFLSFTGFVICGAFPYISGLTTTVTNMGIIYALAPIAIVMFASFLFHEKLSFVQYIGIFTSFFGVAFVIFKGSLSNLFNLNFTLGDLWILAAAISWAFFSIYLVNWKSKFSIFARFTIMSFFGAVILFPFYMIENSYFMQTTFNDNFVVFVILASVFPGVLAFTMYTKLQQLIGASLASLTVYFMPIYGAIYGMILFNETLKIFHLYGAILVLLGIFLANRRKYSK
jgi:drug/metabolite transporter (DMT)-like permease